MGSIRRRVDRLEERLAPAAEPPHYGVMAVLLKDVTAFRLAKAYAAAVESGDDAAADAAEFELNERLAALSGPRHGREEQTQ